MNVHLGHVHSLVRYPVKSMAGIGTNAAFLGPYGLEGDRRFAFRRLNDTSDFPWLSASKLPDLILYTPLSTAEQAEGSGDLRVRTPDGTILALGSPELQTGVEQRFGNALKLTELEHGIFDAAAVSVITMATVSAICREAGVNPDARRFRANIVVATDGTTPFPEDDWVGGRLMFGSGEERPTVKVTLRDVRCMMINLDPDTARQDPGVLKAVVRLNDNNAGAYGTVARTGLISVGDPVTLIPEATP